jgi:hypothetical protein
LLRFLHLLASVVLGEVRVHAVKLPLILFAIVLLVERGGREAANLQLGPSGALFLLFRREDEAVVRVQWGGGVLFGVALAVALVLLAAAAFASVWVSALIAFSAASFILLFDDRDGKRCNGTRDDDWFG